MSGTLFWAVLFSPAWILVLKLHGLYDNDHRRIRHSTLDELPSLISASALGTLALDGLLALSPVGPLSAASAILVGVGALLGSFVAARRPALRLAPPDRGRDRHRDRPGRRRRHGRAASRHPPRDAAAPGRLPLPGRRDSGPPAVAAPAGLDRRHLPGRARARRSSGSSSPSRR